MLPPRQVILQPRDGRPGKDGKDADPAEIERAVREAVASLPGTTLPWIATFIRDDFDITQQVLAGPVDGPVQVIMTVERDEHDRIELVHISAAE